MRDDKRGKRKKSIKVKLRVVMVQDINIKILIILFLRGDLEYQQIIIEKKKGKGKWEAVKAGKNTKGRKEHDPSSRYKDRGKVGEHGREFFKF